MNQTFEAKLQGDLDALEDGRNLQALAPYYDADGAGSPHGRSRRRHRAVEQQLSRPRRPARGRRRRKARPGPVRRRNCLGAFHLRNVRHPPRRSKIASPRFLEREASLSYVACWNANTGLFATICDQGSAIISDELNHASIIDGVRLGFESAARTLQAQRHGRAARRSSKPCKAASRSSS